jgi:hypothetical protein
MKKVIFAILSTSFLVALAYTALPDVVVGVTPLRTADSTTLAAIDRVKSAEKPDSALQVALHHLPAGNPSATLEEKICDWLGVDMKNIYYISYSIFSGFGVKAQSLNGAGEVVEVVGITGKQVLVRVLFRDRGYKYYFLRCGNGMLSPELTRESWGSINKGMGRESLMDLSIQVIIPPGGSLCGSLGVSEEEAIEIAAAPSHRLPFYFDAKGRLHALVHSGEIWVRRSGTWERVAESKTPGKWSSKVWMVPSQLEEGWHTNSALDFPREQPPYESLGK